MSGGQALCRAGLPGGRTQARAGDSSPRVHPQQLMRQLILPVLACLLVGCGSGAPRTVPLPHTGWTVFHSARNGLTVRFPSSWHRARTVLTPYLRDPHEILTLGTNAVRLGPRGACAQMPV